MMIVLGFVWGFNFGAELMERKMKKMKKDTLIERVERLENMICDNNQKTKV